MTRDEVVKIIHIIVATYPNFKPGNISETVDAWYFFLEEFKYQDIAVALKIYVNTSGSGFAPSASELIALINKPAELMSLTEQEAWALVRKAINNSYYHAEEEFEKLPEDVRKIVGAPQMLREWGLTPNESIENVVASNFQRSYRALMSRKTFINALPREARERLQQTEQLRLEDK